LNRRWPPLHFRADGGCMIIVAISDEANSPGPREGADKGFDSISNSKKRRVGLG